MGKKAKSARSLKRKQAKRALKEQRRQLYASYALMGKTKGSAKKVRTANGPVGHDKKKPKHPGWKAIYMAARREAAEKRQAERNKRTSVQQIAVLDSRLGVGVGAVRERKRLNASTTSI